MSVENRLLITLRQMHYPAIGWAKVREKLFGNSILILSKQKLLCWSYSTVSTRDVRTSITQLKLAVILSVNKAQRTDHQHQNHFNRLHNSHFFPVTGRMIFSRSMFSVNWLNPRKKIFVHSGEKIFSFSGTCIRLAKRFFITHICTAKRKKREKM